MYKVELYVRVRRACMVEGMSTREAARVFGLHRDTVRKMLGVLGAGGLRACYCNKKSSLSCGNIV